MNVLSLFDGMSCGQIALQRVGLNVTHYFASEIEPNAVKVTQSNYPKTFQMGNVSKWKQWGIDWSKIDLVMGGSPCQGFSFAGKQLAFHDERSVLFFTFLEILNHVKFLNPNVKFLMENVKMKKQYLDVITSFLGVEPVFINSSLVSAQNRQRYYWCNWDFKPPDDVGLFLKDIIESTSDNYVFMSDKFVARQQGRKCLVNDLNKKAASLSAMEYVKNGRQGDYILHGDRYRKLTPVECERLQTVPDEYTNHVSNTQRYKMLGNGWTVDVIAQILKGLKS